MNTFTSPAESISTDSYVRERMAPHPLDNHYLHLVDLLAAISLHKSDQHLRILDFGCGGSPYRKLFPNAIYSRADIEGDPTLDYIIGSNGKVNAPSSAFDLVISTQVLEHVADPQVYLAECLRVLTNQGKLILTTHGIFEEHGCPFDFHRWTADGLFLQLKCAGVTEVEMRKLTVGARAIMFFTQNWFHMFMNTKHPASGWVMRLMWRQIYRLRRITNAIADFTYGHLASCDTSAKDASIYVAIIATGIKPGA